jgi:dTDP-4-dehydrorhamnose reductase
VKVFISGISGFVGSRLAESLAGEHDLCGSRHSRPGLAADAEIAVLDLAGEPRAVVDLLEGMRPDVVVHCAAISRPAEVAADPRRAQRVNVEAGHWIASWCRRRERPLLAFSSDTVYPDAAHRPAPPGGWSESDAPGPLSEYARSKVALEQAVAGAFPPATLLRCSLVYGRTPAGGNSFTGWLARQMAGEDPVPVFRDNLRHAIAAAQLTGILARLLSAPPAGALNLGGADYLSREAIARRWCAHTGADPARLQPLDQAEARLADPVARELPLDLTRLSALCGEPPGGLDAGLALEHPAP